jgi:hypothetical protein
MKPTRPHQYAVKRKTTGYTRDDRKNEQELGTWWGETVRMIDKGFDYFLKNHPERERSLSASCIQYTPEIPTPKEIDPNQKTTVRHINGEPWN